MGEKSPRIKILSSHFPKKELNSTKLKLRLSKKDLSTTLAFEAIRSIILISLASAISKDNK
ncbi:MAG: hypothetical protein Q8N03_09780 [Ignavibacteria bacterium]|nr:hypothetical protein [Ignavibacteria bacterium]